MTQQITPAPDHHITDAERKLVTDFLDVLLDELDDSDNTAAMFGPSGQIVFDIIHNPHIAAELAQIAELKAGNVELAKKYNPA